MAEMLAVAGPGDHCPGRGVDRPAARQVARSRGPGPVDGLGHHLDGGRLRAGDEPVDLQVAGRRLADEERPGHVAAVAGHLRPEIEEEDRAVQDRSIARRAVGQRRLRARQAGDIEGQRLGAAGPDQPLEAQRELGFGDARTDLRQQGRQRPVGDGAGGRDPFELGRFLDGTVGLQPALDRDQLRPRRRRREPGPGRLRDESGLDRDPPAPADASSSGPAGRQVVVGLKRRASGASRRAWIV